MSCQQATHATEHLGSLSNGDDSKKNNFKLVVLGGGGVGKTAWIERVRRAKIFRTRANLPQALHGTYTDQFDPTIHDTYYHSLSVRGHACDLEIHDISGLDLYDNYTLVRSADALVLAYSVTDKESMWTIWDWAAKGVMDGIPSALIGTKLDMRHIRQISVHEGSLSARQLGAEFFSEVSAKEGTAVDDILPKLTALLMTEIGEEAAGAARVRKSLASKRDLWLKERRPMKTVHLAQKTSGAT